MLDSVNGSELGMEQHGTEIIRLTVRNSVNDTESGCGTILLWLVARNSVQNGCGTEYVKKNKKPKKYYYRKTGIKHFRNNVARTIGFTTFHTNVAKTCGC